MSARACVCMPVRAWPGLRHPVVRPAGRTLVLVLPLLVLPDGDDHDDDDYDANDDDDDDDGHNEDDDRRRTPTIDSGQNDDS